MISSFDTFEKAYARLEHILEKMNSGKVSLEESLQLYEEADQLIVFCQTRLGNAEQKIEMLVKNRAGTLALNADEKPTLEPMSPMASGIGS